MFALKFSTDTDPNRRNKKALAYVAMVLSDAKDKCNTHDGDPGLLVFPCPTLYNISL